MSLKMRRGGDVLSEGELPLTEVSSVNAIAMEEEPWNRWIGELRRNFSSECEVRA